MLFDLIYYFTSHSTDPCNLYIGLYTSSVMAKFMTPAHNIPTNSKNFRFSLGKSFSPKKVPSSPPTRFNPPLKLGKSAQLSSPLLSPLSSPLADEGDSFHSPPSSPTSNSPPLESDVSSIKSFSIPTPEMSIIRWHVLSQYNGRIRKEIQDSFYQMRYKNPHLDGEIVAVNTRFLPVLCR
jgi:hypothetical protein